MIGALFGKPRRGRAGHRRRRAGRGGLAGPALFALLALAILGGPALRQPPPVGNLSEDRGYPAFVRELAGQGILVEVDRDGGAGGAATPGLVQFSETQVAQLVAAHAAGAGGIGQCRLRPTLRDLWHRLTGAASAAEDCVKLLRAFRQASFLREDMRIDDSQVWQREEDRLVGLASGAHVVSDARAAYNAWRGTVQFMRPYTQTMLVDPTTRAPLVRFDPRAARDRLVLAGRAQDSGSAGLIAASIRLRDEQRRCQADVRLSLLGDHVLLTLFPRNRISDCAPVLVDNQPVAGEGEGYGGFDFQLLAPGQIVTFGARDRPLALQVVQSLGAVSAMDDRARRFEPSLAPLGQAVALATPLGRDMVTTIDPQLHFTAQRLLERQAAAELPDERSSFRAAAMLVDGLTGEVLAMPTFPLMAGHLAAGERANSARLAWLGQNQNLMPLPVGSAAKVPFATAIVQAHPELLTLKVTGRGSQFSQILGDRLMSGGFSLHDSAPGDVDFNRFIADSSNYYALLLMRLAAPLDPLARDGRVLAPADRYSLNDRVITRAPALPGPGEGWSASWAPLLWKIACIPPYRQGPGPFNGWWTGPDDACPRYYFDAQQVANPARMGAIAHNSPQLDLDSIDPDSVFADYYMSVLGHNRSTWTNAALVQAYGRIMTDRPLRLRFDRPLPGRPGMAVGSADRIGLTPQVWRAVTGGMRAVIVDGTGRRLTEALGPRFAGVTVMGKTGTATLDYRRPGTRDGREEGHVMVVGFLRFRGSGTDPGGICSARLVAVNFENNDGNSPALRFIQTLMRDPAIAAWASAPCPRETAA